MRQLPLIHNNKIMNKNLTQRILSIIMNKQALILSKTNIIFLKILKITKLKKIIISLKEWKKPAIK